MTDLRKIPWRLPAGYEDFRPFWDDFIKKLGQAMEEISSTVPYSVVRADTSTIDASSTLYTADNLAS